MKDRSTSTVNASPHDSVEDEFRADLAKIRGRFAEFEKKALSANLGERDFIRKQGDFKPAFKGEKRMQTGWLENLAMLQAEEEETERLTSHGSNASFAEQPQFIKNHFSGQLENSQPPKIVEEEEKSCSSGENQEHEPLPRKDSSINWDDSRDENL